MNCFPCFSSQRSKKNLSKREHGSSPEEDSPPPPPKPAEVKPKADEPKVQDEQPAAPNIQAQTFTFRELASATKNFRQECLLGEGGFGRVYKGTIAKTGQVVAVKQLDRNGLQGNKEFLAEILKLSLLNHENLVNLAGYCADGDQRLLVYEFISGGSLEDRLFGNGDKAPLDWFTRMKIASGGARGLQYLHEEANPPVIYRDMKSSNILLDEDLNPKLNDFGLAKLAGGDKMNPATQRVMGTYGYSAPEYVRSGHITLKSDVYSFGVVLLELITGRRAIDTTKPNDEQNLVSWAQPIFRDPKKFPDMADPLLNKNFPEKDLNQAVAIAAMCLQEEAAARPLISDIVTALSFLSVVPPEVIPSSLPPPASSSQESVTTEENAPAKKMHSKSNRKSSKRSRNGSSQRSSPSSSEDGSVSSSRRKSGRIKGSRKSSSKALSRNSSSGSEDDKSRKSSRKYSGKALSHKSSMESEDGFVTFEHSESKASHGSGNYSSGESEDEDGSCEE
ncbi:hypothetical protein L6164_035238 [Bauhinia variegata]|uniref:Uncharacterized protein n=1 Tax=Bauhinia variegata TaxID=167791 RepID=A0ACB9KXT4_BAUVA|nr:hypothetical protein L6164_035238 [Bauhinia variegata]